MRKPHHNPEMSRRRSRLLSVSRRRFRRLTVETLEHRRVLNGDGLDFGDAWDQTGGDANGNPYPTLLEHDGARHVIVPGFFMGHRIDAEIDGQPTPDADGDDYADLADDDGVTLHGPLVAGQTASFTVWVTDDYQRNGTLNAWIDLDGNGDWTSRADEHFVQAAVTHGANRFDIPLPSTATVGPTVVRFRLSTDIDLTPQGQAPDGEVEDYAVDILATKWVQPPEAAMPENVYLGWNEPSYVVEELGTGVIAGDDWLCETDDPVTEIVWWGSFVDWNDGARLPQVLPSYFHFAIWTDVPAGVDDTFSHPGTVIWEYDAYGSSMEWVGWDYDPRTGTYESCYRFSQTLDVEDQFVQPGDDGIYWITISGVYDTETIDHPFGWKTRPRDPDSPAPDDAVRITDPVTANLDDTYVLGAPLEYPEGRSWDLAFELLTPDVNKHEQLPDPNLPGLHTHDALGQPTPSLADNWICLGGDVTDLHWYGNYENNYVGSGIMQFQLSIHSNAVGAPWDLPQDPGNYYIIPFPNVTETDTGIVNIEGSVIYKYEYVLGQPFVQELGEKYWFDITAISNDDADPPLWRWQEAQRGATPIIDPAAEYVEPWQSIQWTNPSPPPDYFYSDMAFAITSLNLGTTKPKWSQLPEPYVPQDAYYGWDEESLYQFEQIVADDWLCLDDRPVTDIHWWGSFLGWSTPDLGLPQFPTGFHIGIWTDVPANGDPFSHPGQMIWENDCDSFDVSFVGWDFDPRSPEAPPEATFYFEQELMPDDWFWQEGDGNIYWLSIAAVYDVPPENVQYPFGWKTRARDTESLAPDDAVRIFHPTSPDLGVNDTYIDGGPIYYPDPEDSWDMAFVLTTPPLDFGDADDSAVAPRYPTLLVNDGARHVIVPDFHLGTLIDPEPGGQPTVNALGDDNDVVYPPANDDEDGVVVTSPLIPGRVAQFDVTVTDPNSLGGVLNGWIDYDGDGSFTTSPQEQFLVDVPVSDGTQTLNIPIPLYADPIQTTARFRLSTQAGLAPNGIAPDGEVEDYTIEILRRDNLKWVQEPDLTSEGIDIRADEAAGLTLADDFECTSPGLVTDVHIWGSWLMDLNGGISNIHLSIHSDDPIGPEGSDPDNVFSHPDLLLWEGNFGPGQFQEVLAAVVPQGEYFWEPMDADPIFPGDTQVYRYDIRIPPAEAFRQEGTPNNPIIYWLDVRVDTLAGQFGWKTRVWPDHFADDAVYALGFDPNPVWNELRYPIGHPYEGDSIDLAFAVGNGIDFGDAPDATGGAAAGNPYPTLMEHDGARHILGNGPFLGAAVDYESDGQPDGTATGDDLVGATPDDEDGVVLNGLLVPGQYASFTITASAPGLVDAWLDFDSNGTWDHPQEQILASVPVVAGPNNITSFVPIPSDAASGDTFARFRISTAGGLSPTGLANDGEVEDYRVTIHADEDSDGVSDEVENGVGSEEDGNKGDGNWDGTPDASQSHVASLVNPVDGTYLTIAAPDGTELNNVVSSSDPPDDPPQDVTFPIGFVDYVITDVDIGAPAMVTIYCESASVLNAYWKYGPTPGNTTPHWYPFMYDGTTGAKILSDRIELYFVDGERGDDDLTANGVIVDPGAPAQVEFPWQNPVLRYNVNNDAVVSSLDVLALIQRINASGIGPLPPRPIGDDSIPSFWDVSGNNELSPVDVLDVIWYINTNPGGEGEQDQLHALSFEAEDSSISEFGWPSVLSSLDVPESSSFPQHSSTTELRLTTPVIGDAAQDRRADRSRLASNRTGLRSATSSRVNETARMLAFVDDDISANDLEKALASIAQEIAGVWDAYK